MSVRAQALKAGNDLVRYLNASPRTPTAEELAAVLEPHLTITAKLDAIVNMSPDVQELREMRAMRRYRDTQIAKAPKADQQRLEDAHNADLEAQEPRKSVLIKQILSRPTTSWRDVVEKAVVAEECAITEAEGGAWHELREDHPEARSVGELVLGIMMLAKLTDGGAERGRNRNAA